MLPPLSLYHNVPHVAIFLGSYSSWSHNGFANGFRNFQNQLVLVGRCLGPNNCGHAFLCHVSMPTGCKKGWV